MAYPLLVRSAALAILTAFAVPLPALAQVQSALHPKGRDAALMADISWIMFIGGALIFVLVMIVLAFAVAGPARLRRFLSGRNMIVGAGIVFPVLTLSALLAYTLYVAGVLKREEPPAARIQVTGEMWWWRVRYLGDDGKPVFETANEIRIPAGLPVELVLTSTTVIHSFWVPNLAGKIDLIPGMENRMRLQADGPGVFRGQCAEYCGAQHAKMMFEVEALTPQDYRAWTEAQRQPARVPDDVSLMAAQQYFMRACASCHTIRGTGAAGSLGPDLTHVGSRRSLAAGVLPNEVGAYAGWIAGSQQIKPGNLMPSFNELSGEGLRSLAHYLESLQ